MGNVYVNFDFSAFVFSSYGSIRDRRTNGREDAAHNTVRVCLCVDMIQMTVSLQQHPRRVSAVHLAGSYILTCIQLALGMTGRRQQCSDVLMRALPTPVVLLLIGLITRRDAGHMRSVDRVIGWIVRHRLRSSDDVIKNKVRDITEAVPK